MNTVKLYISAKSLELGQNQITIVYAEGVLPKLAAKTYHSLVVKTPKGASLTLTRGDTHALWASHQTDKTGFNTLWEVLSTKVGQAVELELVSSTEPIARKGSGSVPVIAIEF